MQNRRQWTLVGTAMVLGWGAGIAGATVVVNDAVGHSSLGAAVTLDAATAGETLQPTPSTARRPSREAARPTADSPASRPAQRRSAPKAVPAPPPRQVAADSPARVPAPARGDSADSAASAASADSAD